MIIYLEGPDGSGKSTLRKKLMAYLELMPSILKELGVDNVIENGEDLIPTRPTNPKRLTLDQLFIKLHKMANNSTTLYICDRGPISDVIYRLFDEYEPVLTLNQYLNIWIRNRYLITTVYCDSDSSLEVLKVRGDDNPVAIANHDAIRYLYKQIMPIFSPLKYDFAKIKTESDLAIVTSLIMTTVVKNLETGRNKQKEKTK